jgi:hypothetical protein
MSSSASLRAVHPLPQAEPAIDLLAVVFSETPVPTRHDPSDDCPTTTDVPVVARRDDATGCPTCAEYAKDAAVLAAAVSRRDRDIASRDAQLAVLRARVAKLEADAEEHTVTRLVASSLTGAGPSLTRVVADERGWWSRLWGRP